MEELIKITQKDGEQAVSARELYDFIGYDKSQWSRWYQTNIINNKFAVENIDYQTLDTMSNGNMTKDFAITISFAKEICMMARTDKGKEARLYFIECEKMLRTKFDIPKTYSQELYLDKNKGQATPLIIKEVEPLISKGSGRKRKRVLCKCGYCGKEFISQKYSITSGKTKSCGCLQLYKTKKNMTTHGDSFSRLNNIFRAMKRRCYNKHCKDYKNYGGRGIKVEFHDYITFKRWAENNGYNENLTIERKNVNKNYNEENCTWIKNKDQSLNRTNTIYVNYNGSNIALCLLCRNKNLNYHTIWQRLYRQHRSLMDSLY